MYSKSTGGSMCQSAGASMIPDQAMFFLDLLGSLSEGCKNLRDWFCKPFARSRR
jgi:hypothetical protein